MNDTFLVQRAMVDEFAGLIAHAVRRATYTRFEVPTADFPAWCVALGVQSFMSFRGGNGATWVSTTHQFAICHQPDVHPDGPDGPPRSGCHHEYRLVSVACDGLPAAWVEFPNGHGDRRYLFASKFRTEETESE